MLFIECCNCPKPFPFDIYIKLDIYFWFILIDVNIDITYAILIAYNFQKPLLNPGADEYVSDILK